MSKELRWKVRYFALVTLLDSNVVGICTWAAFQRNELRTVASGLTLSGIRERSEGLESPGRETRQEAAAGIWVGGSETPARRISKEEGCAGVWVKFRKRMRDLVFIVRTWKETGTINWIQFTRTRVIFVHLILFGFLGRLFISLSAPQFPHL